jgi:radical SAM protein with 4Fe4S-binding SPASM domain
MCDGAIDIGRGGRVWRCFPLFQVNNTSIDKFKSVDEIKDFYNRVLPAKTKGISGRCGKCRNYLRRICSGGCYGYEFL